ncbi:MAG: hypothetical protein K2M44_02120 [Clostridia bacterium]|nr:hypothetical protein [Clostridia bacterium]
MKKKKLLVLFLTVSLLIAAIAVTGVLAGCQNKKEEAVITSAKTHNFIYDGQAHTITATLNHTECELEYYSRGKLGEKINNSFKNAGKYQITIVAPETEHFQRAELNVTVNVTQNISGLIADVASSVSVSVDKPVIMDLDTSLIFTDGAVSHIFAIVAKTYIDCPNDYVKGYAEINVDSKMVFGIYLDGSDLYVNVKGNKYKYADADAGSLFTIITSKEITDIDVGKLVNMVLGVILDSDSILSKGNGSYDIQLSTAKIWAKLSPIAANFLDGNLKYSDGTPAFEINGHTVDYNFIDTVLKNNDLSLTMSVDTAGGVFRCSASGNITTSERFGSKRYGISLNVNKFSIATDGERLETLPIDGKHSEYKEIKLLNTDIEGTVTFSGDNGNKVYDYVIKADFDPFVIINSVSEGYDKDRLTAALMQSGYIYMDVSSSDADPSQPYTHIKFVYDPVHSGSTQVYAFIKLDSDTDAFVITLDIMDFIDLIGGIGNNSVIAPDIDTGAPDLNPDDILNGDVIKRDHILKAVAAGVRTLENFIKTPAEGITFEVSMFEDALIAFKENMQDVQIDVDAIITSLFGDYASFNIKVTTSSYGETVTDFNAYGTLNGSKYYDNATQEVKDIKFLNEIEVDSTEAIVINKDDVINSVNSALADRVTAKYTDGTTGSGYAVSVCGVEGLDLTSTQEQTVKLYMYVLRDESTSCFGLMAVEAKVKIGG